jgi:hypothetical protein
MNGFVSMLHFAGIAFVICILLSTGLWHSVQVQDLC